MPFQLQAVRLDNSAGPLRRALQYAFYNWTREMPKSRRAATLAGVVLQGYPAYVLIEWGGALPTRLYPYFLVLPHGPLGYAALLLIYYAGYCLVNAMLTAEFVRKTQLEGEQLAARQIQQTLQPQQLEPISGYTMESLYVPFREVSGDYFDVIDLPARQTLFALADVSGKGMPAALLAANIQALVRTMAGATVDPVALAEQINRHLVRYTPGDRFATAVFIVLDRASGAFTYVNAGHNPPILYTSGATTTLPATGLPLGLLSDARYQAEAAKIDRGGCLLLFTDGLSESIPGPDPEALLRKALEESPPGNLAALQSLIDPKSTQDDVTILLVKRTSQRAPA